MLALERATAVITHILPNGNEASAGSRETVFFSDAPGPVAIRERWFRTLNDYVLYAELAFIGRYPDHPFAEDLMSRTPTLRLADLPKLLRDRALFERWAREAHTVRERM